MDKLATTREKLVASRPNPVALATPQVTTSSPDQFNWLFKVMVFWVMSATETWRKPENNTNCGLLTNDRKTPLKEIIIIHKRRMVGDGKDWQIKIMSLIKFKLSFHNSRIVTSSFN